MRLPSGRIRRYREGGWILEAWTDIWMVDLVLSRKRRDRYGVLEPVKLSLRCYR